MKLLDLRNWLLENDVDDIWWMSVDGNVYTDPVSLNEAARNKEINPLAEVMVLPVAYADVAEPPWQELDLDDPHVEAVQDSSAQDESPEILEPESMEAPPTDAVESGLDGLTFDTSQDILISPEDAKPPEEVIPDTINPPVQDPLEGAIQEAPEETSLEPESTLSEPLPLEPASPPEEEEPAKPEKGKKKGSKKSASTEPATDEP